VASSSLFGMINRPMSVAECNSQLSPLLYYQVTNMTTWQHCDLHLCPDTYEEASDLAGLALVTSDLGSGQSADDSTREPVKRRNVQRNVQLESVSHQMVSYP